MEIENPYAAEKQHKYKVLAQLKSPEHDEQIEIVKKEITELEYKSREFTAEILKQHTSKIEKIVQQKAEVKKLYPVSINRQYNAYKDLHKEAKKLTKEIGEAKLKVLHEMRPPEK